MLLDKHALASLTLATVSATRFISDRHDHVNITDLQGGSCFTDIQIDQLQGKSVLLTMVKQLPTVLALLELAGVARRVLLCSPDTLPHLPTIITDAEIDVVVMDDNLLPALGVPMILGHGRLVARGQSPVARDVATEWVLFTSGTTGRPKMVLHTLPSLSGPLNDGVKVADDAVWSTFYDIRRYGGLQILLRALIGGGSMVLSCAEETVSDFLLRLGRAGITHISGTPSHWRRALMSPMATAITPAYVRLSGEVADQRILDQLRSRYPNAAVAHAFASTEAGVGFDVRDGLAGFPANFVPHPNNNPAIELEVVDDTLRIRSTRTAMRYLGERLPEANGFIDTGDLLQKSGDRYYFMGRKNGVINVGGQKVYPEEIETIITQHPDVVAARVWSRKNPITGAIVAADIALHTPVDDTLFIAITTSLRTACRQVLAPYKVPATWRQVETIEMSAAGKIQRA